VAGEVDASMRKRERERERKREGVKNDLPEPRPASKFNTAGADIMWS